MCWGKISCLGNSNRKNRVGGRKYRKVGGYLTVFLALVIPIILSLIFVLLDGARRNAVRLQTELSADTAVNSVLAEFSKELLIQYDLLMVDTSYGGGSPGTDNLKAHLQQYLNQNLSSGGIQRAGSADFTRTFLSDLSVTETRYALDDGCGVLREQVNAYLSAEPIGSLTSAVLENANGYNGFGFDLTEWSRQKGQNEEQLREGLEAARERRKHKSENAEENSEETEEDENTAEALEYAQANGIDEEHAADPWKEVNIAWNTPILTLAMGTDSSVSGESIDAASFLSSRSWNQGTGWIPENSHHYSQADALLMNEYIFEKCGNYQHPLEKGRLQYQMEYLLNGCGSDRENLEKTAKTLLLIRLAANTMFVMSDSGKKSEAKIWGTIASLLCLCPELEEIFTTAILLAWSFAESVNDLKILFAGGKVPMMKTSDTWKTSLLSIFKPGLGADGGSGGSGLDYTGYVRMLLFLENGDMRDYRLMDVMEMDIRKAEGSNSFRMDGCLDAFVIEASVTSSFGYQYQIQREGSYE